MNKLTSFASKVYSRTKVKAGKKAPLIAVTVGLIGMGGALYLTYRAKTKIEEAKAEKQKNLELVDGYLESGCITDENGKVVDVYNTTDAERDTKIYNSRYIVACAKYLAPAVLTFIISATLIALGFKTMAARLATAGATIAGLTAQLSDVKKELDDAVGKEKADEILLGANTVTETELGEDGSISQSVKTTTNRYVCGYTFEFSKRSSPVLFSGDYKRDNDFILGNMRHANWLMDEKKGYVTFNDILESFEVPPVSYGQTDGSVETPGHTIVFDVQEHKEEDFTWYSITPNIQGFILNKI